MFILTNLLVAVAQILDYVLWAYTRIVAGRVIIFWVDADRDNPVPPHGLARGSSTLRRSWSGSRSYSSNGFSSDHFMIWPLR